MHKWHITSIAGAQNANKEEKERFRKNNIYVWEKRQQQQQQQVGKKEVEEVEEEDEITTIWSVLFSIEMESTG